VGRLLVLGEFCFISFESEKRKRLISLCVCVLMTSISVLRISMAEDEKLLPLISPDTYSHNSTGSLKESFELDPKQFLQFGNQLQTVDFNEHAMEAYAKAVEIDPSCTAKAMLKQAHLYVKLNKLKEAIQCFEEAIQSQTDAASVQDYSKMASTYYKLGIYEKVISTLDRVEEQALPVDILIRKAKAFSKLGQNEKSIHQYDQIIERNPTAPQVLVEKAVLLERLNRASEALNTYDQAIMLNPKDVSALNYKANLLVKLCRYAEGIQSCDQILELQPTDVNILMLKGEALQAANGYLEAIGAFQKATEVEPEYVEAYLEQVSCHVRLGKLQESLDLVNRAISLNGDFASAYQVRAYIYVELGRLEEAVVDASKAVEMDSMLAFDCALCKAIVLRKQKKFAEALSLVKDSSDEEGKHASNVAKAAIFCTMGQFREAEKLCFARIPEMLTNEKISAFVSFLDNLEDVENVLEKEVDDSKLEDGSREDLARLKFRLMNRNALKFAAEGLTLVHRAMRRCEKTGALDKEQLKPTQDLEAVDRRLFMNHVQKVLANDKFNSDFEIEAFGISSELISILSLEATMSLLQANFSGRSTQ
jgi:tetratricopeptide (TPR) repeat protein